MKKKNIINKQAKAQRRYPSQTADFLYFSLAEKKKLTSNKYQLLQII